MQLWALKIEGFYGCLYTPLYEKGIKETQNEPMETTVLFFYSFGIDSHHHPMLYSPWQSLLFYLFRWKQRGKEDHSASWRRAPSPIKMTTVSLKNTDTIFKTTDHCVSYKKHPSKTFSTLSFETAHKKYLRNVIVWKGKYYNINSY